LYWKLTEPYVIDDAGPVRPIGQFWVDAKQADGSPILKANGKPKKCCRNYVRGNQSDGEPQIVWEYPTDERTGGDSKTKNWQFPNKLSAKALCVQDDIQGIEKKLGSDHTHDLARLLRLPGTMNRKDERTGRAPVSCELVECDPARRYAFAEFEKFAALSSDREKRQKTAAIPLKKTRLTPVRANRLTDHITRCGLAERGTRSQFDFALCCQ
jgi:hypothetical protein